MLFVLFQSANSVPVPHGAGGCCGHHSNAVQSITKAIKPTTTSLTSWYKTAGSFLAGSLLGGGLMYNVLHHDHDHGHENIDSSMMTLTNVTNVSK